MNEPSDRPTYVPHRITLAIALPGVGYGGQPSASLKSSTVSARAWRRTAAPDRGPRRRGALRCSRLRARRSARRSCLQGLGSASERPRRSQRFQLGRDRHRLGMRPFDCRTAAHRHRASPECDLPPAAGERKAAGDRAPSEQRARLAGPSGGIQFAIGARVHLGELVDPGTHRSSVTTQSSLPAPRRSMVVLMSLRRVDADAGCSARGHEDRRSRRRSHCCDGCRPTDRRSHGRRQRLTVGFERRRCQGDRAVESEAGGEMSALDAIVPAAIWMCLPPPDRVRAERDSDGRVPARRRPAGPLGDLLVPDRRRPRGRLRRGAWAPRGHRAEHRTLQRIRLGRRAPVAARSRQARRASPSATSTATTPSSIWSHQRLGQPTHRDVLVTAREGGSDHVSLTSWWRPWHHLSRQSAVGS